MSRVLMALSCAGALALLAPGLRAADDPKAVVARAVKVHGGEDYLSKMKAGRSKNKGKINLPGIGEAEFTQETAYMLPDKFKESMELEVMGQKIAVKTLASGDAVSIEANGMQVPVNDAIKAAMNDARHMMKVARMVSLLKEPGFELSAFGEEKVEGKPAVGVRVSAKGQKDITLFFDKETGLLAKVQYRSTDPMTQAERDEERIVVEYGPKNADGVVMPKKMLVKHDGKTFMEVEVVESKLLEKLDDAEFKKSD
jgi:hypothetical protein